jgi:hypothetical protein
LLTVLEVERSKIQTPEDLVFGEDLPSASKVPTSSLFYKGTNNIYEGGDLVISLLPKVFTSYFYHFEY